MDDRAINKKIKELWKDSQELNKNALDTERSELIDLSPEELAEVEQVVRGTLARQEKLEARKPKRRWTWRFYGLHLFRFLMWCVEILVVSIIVYFLLPYVINNDVGVLQSTSIVTLLAVIKKWMK